MADAKFTKAEIVAWSEEAGRRLTPELLSRVPLTEQQRARVKQLRAEAEERLKGGPQQPGVKPNAAKIQAFLTARRMRKDNQ